jgi:CheY-like chemotaxis protein
MLDDLLDLVQLEHGEMRPHLEEGSLEEVVGEASRAFTPAARGKRLQLALEVRRNVPVRVRFDRGRVERVVRHLIDNAVKFTDRGRITVRLRVDPGPMAVVSVADTGPGLDPSRFEELCTALMQGDQSLSRSHPGCGVGLALARGIARQLGGDLTCQGGPGRGTTVRFRFRLEPAEGHPFTPARSGGALRGRVLLVEDGLDNQALIRGILERIGLEVEIAPDGEAGVDAALHGDFDLVLMDIQMPRMDGVAATRVLRAHGFDTPIVALTANAGDDSRQRCLDAGCDDFMTKPVDRMALVERVARLLDPKPRDAQKSV